MIKAEVRGMDELRRKLGRLESAARSQALNKVAYGAALIVEAQTKENIREDGLVDTGFMINSVVTETPDQRSANPTSGGPGRELLPETPVEQGQAILSIGAEYARNLHDGTGIYNPEGRKTPWVYYDERLKRFVTTSGFQGTFFMLRAFRSTKRKCVATAGRLFKLELARLGAGGS